MISLGKSRLRALVVVAHDMQIQISQALCKQGFRLISDTANNSFVTMIEACYNCPRSPQPRVRQYTCMDMNVCIILAPLLGIVEQRAYLALPLRFLHKSICLLRCCRSGEHYRGSDTQLLLPTWPQQLFENYSGERRNIGVNNICTTNNALLSPKALFTSLMADMFIAAPTLLLWQVF